MFFSKFGNSWWNSLFQPNVQYNMFIDHLKLFQAMALKPVESDFIALFKVIFRVLSGVHSLAGN